MGTWKSMIIHGACHRCEHNAVTRKSKQGGSLVATDRGTFILWPTSRQSRTPVDTQRRRPN